MISEINGTTGQAFGQHQRGHVYANGEELAEHFIGSTVPVASVFTDPSSAVHVSLETGIQQLDPLGNDVGDTNPYLPEIDPGFIYPNSGDVTDGPGGCTADDQPLPCTMAGFLPSWSLGRWRRMLDPRMRTPGTFPTDPVSLRRILMAGIEDTPWARLFPNADDLGRWVKPTFFQQSQNSAQNQAPQTIPCVFNINLTGNGLGVDELLVTMGTIMDIFQAANLGVVFGQRRLANGGSVSLNVSNDFPRQAAGHDPDDNGISLQGRGRAWVSVNNTVTYGGKHQATTASFRGLAIGRVAAHEVTHGLGIGHGGGLMRRSFGMELFDENADANFRLSQRAIARLRARCQGRRRR